MLKTAALAGSRYRDRLYGLRHDSITRLIFALLLATIFVHLWFASAPLPLGGPNVILGFLTVLLAVSYTALRFLLRAGVTGTEAEASGEWRKRAAAAIFATAKDFRPVIPIIAVSLLLLTWMLAVYLFTDTLVPKRMGQIVMGIGILFAAYLSVDSVRRATLAAAAIILATFVSALFGHAVIGIGEPFSTVWLSISTLKEATPGVVLGEGRLAGLSPDVSDFSYRIATGVPLAFAAVISNAFGHSAASQRAYYAAAFVILMTMVLALVTSATRSAILGTLATAFFFLPCVVEPHLRRRLFITVPLVAACLIAIYNPIFNVSDAIGLSDEEVQYSWTHSKALTLFREGPPFRIDTDGEWQISTRDASAWETNTSEPWTNQALVAEADDLERERLASVRPGDTILIEADADNWAVYSVPQVIVRDLRVTFWYLELVASAGDKSSLVNDASATLYYNPAPGADANDQEVMTGGDVRVKRIVLNTSDVGLSRSSDRIMRFSNLTSRVRIPMIITALRYSLDYPLGTGRYYPSASHVSAGWDARIVDTVLAYTPHNQFLNILVYFGFPGLILLILFYVLILISLIYSARLVIRSRDEALYLLIAGVAGGLAAYGVNSLLHNNGPFMGDWGHFFIIGLAFSIQRIAASRNANGEAARP